MIITNTIINISYTPSNFTARVADAVDWLRSQGWQRATGVPRQDWDWDYLTSHGTAAFMFVDPRKAAQFKLVWGGVCD